LVTRLLAQLARRHLERLAGLRRRRRIVERTAALWRRHRRQLERRGFLALAMRYDDLRRRRRYTLLLRRDGRDCADNHRERENCAGERGNRAASCAWNCRHHIAGAA